MLNKKFLLFGILFIAAFLRLYRISDYMTFLGDEGRDVLITYEILHGHLTLLGPTASVGGFFLGPIYYYFMAPFLWLFKYDPVGPAVMVALFGIATVFLVYKVGNKFFGTIGGLISALLYSISPLIIAYSRSSWNPNLMPFFSLLSLCVIYKAISLNRVKLFVLCGFLLGIAMQLHYLAIFLGVVIASYVFIIRIILIKSEPLSKVLFRVAKEYILIFSGFIVGWLPFLMFEFRHGFPNIRSIFNFIFSSGNTGGNEHFSDILKDVFFRLFGRLITKFPPPEQVNLNNDLHIGVWYHLTFVLGILSVLIFLIKYKDTFKKLDNKFKELSLIFVWLFVGIFMFGFYKKSIYDYYFGFMFPLPFLLVGFSLSRINKFLGVLILAVLVWINLTGIPFGQEPNRQKEQVKKISQFVLSKTGGKPFNFALITGGNSDHGYRYFFKLEGRDPTVIQNPQIDPERKTVTNQLLVVCEDLNCRPLGDSLWEVAGFGRGEIIGKWDVSVVKVYKLKHYKGK